MRLPRVAIIGYALAPYSGESFDSGEVIGYRMFREALERAGLTRERISSVHNSTMDLFDGVTISNGILAPACGGYDRDCTRVQNGGVFAVISACASILSGASEVAVVSSVDCVETDPLQVSNFSSAPYLEQPLGMNSLTSYALFSSAWMDERGVAESHIADVAANSYRHGAANARAHVRKGHSREDVLQSEMIASPLRALHVAPDQSYGAAALILASERASKSLEIEPTYITGFGMSTWSDHLEDWLDMTAVERAADDAYARADVNSPSEEIAAVEIGSPFAPFELAAYAALRLCSAGEEAALLASASSNRLGMRINSSGGTLCTNALNSGGLFRLVHAVTSLNDHRTTGRRRALVHDSDLSLGVAGSSHAVLILEGSAVR